MMQMTCSSFMQVLLKVDMSVVRAFVAMAEQKGATAAKQKWCHGNISENDATTTYRFR